MAFIVCFMLAKSENTDEKISDSDNIDTKLPDHEFQIKESIGKSGKNKGNKTERSVLSATKYKK